MKSTQQKILSYIKEHGRTKPSELSDLFSINRQMIHRHLKKLLDGGEIKKIGIAPVVYYQIKKHKILDYKLENSLSDLIDKNFMFIDADGSRYDGIEAFIYWCKKRGFDFNLKAKEYISIFNKYEKYKENGLINASFKLKESFNDLFLDNLYYLDFYSIEVFGKTKLGQMLLYAKQSQNKKIMEDVVSIINKKIINFVGNNKYDAVIFVPPTVKRDLQFMTFLEKKLQINLPKIVVNKIKTEIVVPQKTLKKKEDRILNADTTFAISEKRTFNKVLIIDDAVGSGATIHQIAMKLKKQGVSQYVDGVALVGSFNGFDVLNEV